MKLYRRENYLKKIRGFFHETDLIKVISGVRRCGKSSLMHTIADEIIENGVSKKNIIFIDLKKRGYRSIKTPDALEEVIDKACEKIKGIKYLFIDEIQNVKGFEDVIEEFRLEEEFSIFITGSNSYLLSGELATNLTGRYLEFEMFPLTFEEYLKMKEFYKKPIDNNLAKELDIYIYEGGFPRSIRFNSLEEKRAYTKGVIIEIFEKDIKRRVKIKNKEAFLKIQKYLINNYGVTTSISNITKELNNNGLVIKRDTVVKYIQALVDAKILYECNRFDMKSKTSLGAEQKYYLSDLSFYYSTNVDNRINYGPALENIVYQYAYSKDYEISVGKIGKLECDFILRKNSDAYAYVQVAYSIAINKETEEREYRSLEKAIDFYPRYLLTNDTLTQGRSGIKHCYLPEFIKEGRLFE